MKQYFLFTLTVLLLGACSETGDEPKTSMDDQLDQVIGLSESEFTGKLDELLTLEMAATSSGLPKESAKVEYNQVLKNPKTHSLSYNWDSERTQTITVSGRSFDVPKKNRVEISWVGNTTLEEFKRNYHNPTEEELRNAEAAMDAKMDELEQEGKATKEQSDAARGMVDGFMANFHVTEVSGLGDYAVWIDRKESYELKVFYKGLEFQLIVDLSDDQASNKKKAIALARRIITEKLN